MSDNSANQKSNSVSAFSMYKKEHCLNIRQEKQNRKHSVVKKALTRSKKQKLGKNIQRYNETEFNSSDNILQELKLLPKQFQDFEHHKKNVCKFNNKVKPGNKDSASSPMKHTGTPKIFNGSLQGDNPEVDALQLFNWMIAPLPRETFLQTYWEQKVSHIKRLNPNYYRHIFNSSALDEIIRNNILYYTRNVDVVSYENGVKEVHNLDGRATAAALWDYYSNGCSIRVLNPQTYNHRVHLLLATLQEYFGTMVGANVYLTPPNSQGFAPHYDDIEAFILQLEGQKHWKLYQPDSADVLARFSSPNLEHKNIGDPFLEVTLKAGDMLYFPRGTIHEGHTDMNLHSLHITVSVYQQTSYTDLLQHVLTESLQKASRNYVEFRQGLPLNYLKHFGAGVSSETTELRKAVNTKVESLISKVVKFADVDAAADLLGKKFIHDSMPPVLSREEAKRSSKADGPYLQNGQVINKIEIDLNSRIRLLRYYCIRLVTGNDSSHKLYYNTENATIYHGEEEQWLELDATMVCAIQMLQNTYPRYIDVGDLPMEDANLKMQLISDLWEHGLIVTERPLQATKEQMKYTFDSQSIL